MFWAPIVPALGLSVAAHIAVLSWMLNSAHQDLARSSQTPPATTIHARLVTPASPRRIVEKQAADTSSRPAQKTEPEPEPRSEALGKPGIDPAPQVKPVAQTPQKTASIKSSTSAPQSIPRPAPKSHERPDARPHPAPHHRPESQPAKNTVQPPEPKQPLAIASESVSTASLPAIEPVAAIAPKTVDPIHDTVEKELRLVTQPRYRSTPAAPSYPRKAKRKRQQGTVLLRILVSAEGENLDIKLHRSSGFELLDEAAIEAVAKWEFVPASADGEKVLAWVEVPVEFRLR